MNHPWTADRELTDEQALRAVRDQFPELACTRIELLGSGWDNDAFLVDDAWVFRFPRRAGVAAEMDAKHRMARLAAGALADSDVTVPVFDLLGAPSAAFPYRFSGYRWIPGVAADRVDMNPHQTRAMAQHLGAILSRLHATPIDTAREARVPSDHEGPRDWYVETVAIADDLYHRESAQVQECVDWLRAGPDVPASYAGPPRFLHNDICPDHVLVDADRHRIVGLIDLDDASLGDPVLDFVVLPPWMGWDAARRALGAYERETDRAFVERWTFMSRIVTLKWLHDTHLRGGNVEKHREWVRRTFEF